MVNLAGTAAQYCAQVAVRHATCARLDGFSFTVLERKDSPDPVCALATDRLAAWRTT